MCYELAWKTIQELLKKEGLEACKSPKQCFKEAFQLGLITDEQGFVSMIENRNLTTHTYDEKLAESVYQHISDYLLLLRNLYQKTEQRLN